jgi:hypothetical protein
MRFRKSLTSPEGEGVGATSACLREAASAKAGRPLEREAKASPTQPATDE